MKKLAVLFGICLLAGSLFVGGCRKKASAPAGGTQGEVKKGALAKGDVTFTAFIVGLNNLVSSYDYKDNVFTRRVVDETGINLEFIASSGADAPQRLNVLLNTGDYPDLIIDGSGNSRLSIADLAFYGKEGIFLALDQYDPMSFPNIKAAFDEYPAFNDILRGPDGKLYGLPAANDCIHCRYGNNQGLYYKPFMDKYGKPVPQTLDELTAYLRWVRDNDVNGNGNKNDEIPMAFEKDSLRVFVDIFAKSFMPFVNINYFGLSRNGKEVVEQYKAKEFRDTLKYLAAWYKEGLILPDSFSQPRQQLQALATQDTPVIAVSTSNAANNNGSEYYYRARWLPVLTGPAGEKHAFDLGPWSILRAGMFITDKCKDPKLALGLYNYFLNFDVMLDGYVGPKGYGWDDADPNGISLMGEKATYKILKTYATADVNYTWDQNAPMLRNRAFRYGEQANEVPRIQEWLKTGDLSLLDAMKANKSYNEVKNVLQATVRIPDGTPMDKAVPPLPMDAADTRRIGDINAVLETALDSYMVEFITGARDINNDAVWNAYLADLDRMGSKEKAAIIQKYLK
ncbi:MAG: extracellular solute-binding protein [Treponema sp.]|nr:extracellular solute-binding protein [Treponema sp.]